MKRSFIVTSLLVICISLTSQQPIQGPGSPASAPALSLSPPLHQADFTAVIADGYHGVSWANGYMVSFGLGEMKEPITVFDKSGNWLFANPLSFPGARLTYGQDAVATKSGTAIVAASATTADGAFADVIAEVDKDGIRRIIRTTPFYPERVCVTDEGTVWAFGKELTPDRTAKPGSKYPLLREYSFDKGQLRSTLDRSTYHPPSGVTLTGKHGDVFLQCGSSKITLESGATNELFEYDLASATLSRLPLPSLGDSFYMTGAALTKSGDIYVSAFRPGQQPLTTMIRFRTNSSGVAERTSAAMEPVLKGNFYLLLGNDGDDLVYTRGRGSPAVFWSAVSEVSK